MRFFDVFHPARARGGEHFLRAAQSVGIKCVPHEFHCFQIVHPEKLVHEIDLLDTDAVFPGHAAAQFDAAVENLVARFQHTLHLIGVTLVEQQNRVNVAVARVEDVHNADVVRVSPIR